MKTKQKRVEQKEYRVCFKTADGSLLTNYAGDRELWTMLSRHRHVRPYGYDVDRMLAQLGREKGFKVVSYEITDAGVTGIGEWL